MTHKCSTIIPSLDYLNKARILTDLECTVLECGELFSNVSALNLHLKKVHKMSNVDQDNVNLDQLVKTKARTKSQKLSENCSCKYYCPVEGCKHNVTCSSTNANAALPTFHSVKLHYIRMHGERTYTCPKCQQARFSIKSEMERHEMRCGLVFRCATCQCPFASFATLARHARKKAHELPAVAAAKPSTTTMDSSPNTSASSSNSIASSPLAAVFILAPNNEISSSPSSASSPVIILPPPHLPSTYLVPSKLVTAAATTQTNSSDRYRRIEPKRSSLESSGGETAKRARAAEEVYQRSLGCQTQATSTQESASQSDQQQQQQQQQQQRIQEMADELAAFLVDASTSTQPFEAANLTTFWAEMSTQTQLSALSSSQAPAFASTSYSAEMQHREIQTSSLVSCFTQTTTTTTTTTTQLDDDELFRGASSSPPPSSSLQQQSNRCVTPMLFYTATACQTDEMTTSDELPVAATVGHHHQQQQQHLVDNLTQTDWEFNMSDFLAKNKW